MSESVNYLVEILYKKDELDLLSYFLVLTQRNLLVMREFLRERLIDFMESERNIWRGEINRMISLILANEGVWIILIFLLSLGVLSYYKSMKPDNEYVKDLSKALLGSFVALAVIFSGYFFFHSEYGLFDKLVSGEVIVGVAVAFPVLFTWYRKDQKEKADSKAIQEEEKKRQKERYAYQVYTDLKSDYLAWFNSFYRDNMNPNIALVNLEQIIDRGKMLNTISGIETNYSIDFRSLFVAIQEKLKERSIENEEINKINSMYDSWRIINNKIISIILEDKNDIKNAEEVYAIDFIHHHAKNAEEVYAIDFTKKPDMLKNYVRASRFIGCKFNSEKLIEFIEGDGQYEFDNTFLDEKLTSQQLSRIENDVKLKSYFYTDSYGKTSLFDIGQEKAEQAIDGDQEILDEEQEQGSEGTQPTAEQAIDGKQGMMDKEQSSEAPPSTIEKTTSEPSLSVNEIYENRDLSDFGEINKFVECQQSIKVTLNDDNSNIKQQIFDALKRFKEKGSNTMPFDTMTKDNSFVSRSKNFVPEMKADDQKTWKWHSWNVLTNSKTKDTNIEFFIFAVEISKNIFECIVIKRENLKELLTKKTQTKDERYFFYFASKNEG